MKETKTYRIRKLWLLAYAFIGILLLILTVINLASKGLSTTNIITGIISILSLYQAWSFNISGYVKIGNQQISINSGIWKKKINISEIKEIKNLKNSYQFLLKNERKAHISLNVVYNKDRDDLINELEKLKTSHNTK